ncbi:molybdenum cofactor guanylyltransferase [Blastomonas sp. SL216]|uniref:molybdenum cofactor guanylyltransferase n=1 Tax=Blastomonas sp. SL216 TaxID=2995169 RepID=UPI0023775A17|nr:NTP transferase domain-containing protein [Blastomonas sp. SL216]
MTAGPPKAPVVVLLAGGRSRRMQGLDKALAEIAGQRMIDRVLARLDAQAETIWLSAPHDYDTGLHHVTDGAMGPPGPVGAVRALAAELSARGGDAFITCPVDAPFVPADLVARLAAHGPVAMAEAKGAVQPVFALWSARAVLAALPPERCSERWSLQRLGTMLGARSVAFDDALALMNVNTPEDLTEARQHAARA